MMSHGGMTPEVAQALAQDADVGAQIDKAEEIASNYDDDDRKDIKTDVMNAFYAGVKWREENPLPPAKNQIMVVPHTLGGFSGAFYVAHRREPTQQEIFDAGVRSGLKRAEEARGRTSD
jgi:hypothetical protein